MTSVTKAVLWLLFLLLSNPFFLKKKKFFVHLFNLYIWVAALFCYYVFCFAKKINLKTKKHMQCVCWKTNDTIWKRTNGYIQKFGIKIYYKPILVLYWLTDTGTLKEIWLWSLRRGVKFVFWTLSKFCFQTSLEENKCLIEPLKSTV